MSESPAKYVFGLALFPRFEVLDVFGPIEALNQLTRLPGYTDLTLHIIADTLEPVSSATTTKTFEQKVVPTHTFKDAPSIDVLLVPGGMLDTEETQPAVDFIKARYSSLQYLITVCTGSGLAARAGVLDGRCATTNKKGWKFTTAFGPKTYWIAQARWVVDGNIWTTSGVSAGTDGMIAWIEQVYGGDKADEVVLEMEYFRNPNPNDDPFAALDGDKDVPPVDGNKDVPPAD